jgi:hypothetical protein
MTEPTTERLRALLASISEPIEKPDNARIVACPTCLGETRTFDDPAECPDCAGERVVYL